VPTSLLQLESSEDNAIDFEKSDDFPLSQLLIARRVDRLTNAGDACPLQPAVS